MNMKVRGFTLVELMIVVAILAIVATIAVVGIKSCTEQSLAASNATMVYAVVP